MKNGMTAEEWVGKGVALSKLGKHEEALNAYNKAVEINPQYAKAWYNKGDALYVLNRYEETLEAYEKAVKLDPLDQDAEVWSNISYALTMTGRDRESMEAFNVAYEMDSKAVMLGTHGKAAFWGRMTGESIVLGIMLAAGVLIWGWAMGLSISSVELQGAILCGGIACIASGLILSLWIYKNTSVYSVIIFLRIFFVIAIVIGLVVWLVRTLAGC